MATIAAIASPPGAGGVGIIRLSGPDSLKILKAAVKGRGKNFTEFKPRVLHYALLVDSSGDTVDECLAVHMPGPHTFTGEDVAEIHCHGSPLIVQCALERCLELGARQAEKGEFSRRAFLNGRLDLSQAEAVAEIVAAPSRDALRYSLKRLSGQLSTRVRHIQDELNELSVLACVAIDFPDDEIPPLSRNDFIDRTDRILEELAGLLTNAKRASTLQNGSRILLLGPVNAGKSSILNTLSGRQRALVSDQPGTTRDYLEVNLNLDGLTAQLLDTAGLRPSELADPIENLGMDQSLALMEEADLVWLILDLADSEADIDAILKQLQSRKSGAPVIVVWNKLDLGYAPKELPGLPKAWPQHAISARTGAGLEKLVAKSREILLETHPGDGHGLAPNLRQARELEKARQELVLLKTDLEAGQPFDVSMSSLDAANSCLDMILGVATHDELLDKIFSQFCIGK